MIAWFFVASAYVLAFMQRMAPQSVNAALMGEFGLNAASVSWLTAAYFWGYTLMQIPAGPIVDLVGARRVALASMLISALGTFGFAASPNATVAFAARLMIACGDALVFTILLKLVANAFADRRFGLMSGLSQASGYLGGALATAPLAFWVASHGWRDTFTVMALLCVVNLAGCFFFLRGQAAPPAKAVDIASLFAALRRHVRDIASWGCAVANASHFVVVSTLAGVWGLPMIAHTFDVTPVQAGQPLALFMAGNVVGSVVIGGWADRFRSLIAPLATLFLLRVALMLLLAPVLARELGFGFLLVNFLALGILSGGVVPVVLKCVRNLYTPAFMGTGASFSMVCAGVATAVLLPALGWGMQRFAVQDAAPTGITALTDGSFYVLVGFLAAAGLVGVAGTALLLDGF